MQYDATRAALLHPHARETLFRSGQDWPIEAVCAECSRLAYVPFEQLMPWKTVLRNTRS